MELLVETHASTVAVTLSGEKSLNGEGSLLKETYNEYAPIVKMYAAKIIELYLHHSTKLFNVFTV